VEFQKARWILSEKENEARAKAAGCSITYLTPQAQAEFVAAVQPIYAEYSEFKDLISQIKATR
jgi:TRAP-type C4-dicarboxylate transport system substrate-binding protein